MFRSFLAQLVFASSAISLFFPICARLFTNQTYRLSRQQIRLSLVRIGVGVAPTAGCRPLGAPPPNTLSLPLPILVSPAQLAASSDDRVPADQTSASQPVQYDATEDDAESFHLASRCRPR